MFGHREKLIGIAGWAFFLIVFAGCHAVREGRSADQPAGQRISIKAWIDEKCQSHPGNFKVPNAKTAFDFKRDSLAPGVACKAGETVENKGFAIRDSKNQPVYMWSQYKDQTPYEKGGPLANLTLSPGEYILSVAGGKNAKVEISYRLK